MREIFQHYASFCRFRNCIYLQKEKISSNVIETSLFFPVKWLLLSENHKVGSHQFPISKKRKEEKRVKSWIIRMKPNKIKFNSAFGSYLQECYCVSVSAESRQAALRSCECFCHACFLMNMLLCFSPTIEHHMSENMLVPLKAVRWWPVGNMSAEPADTKHTVLFKHINAGGGTQINLSVSAICHANDSCCSRDHRNEKWRWRSRRCLVSRWRRMTGQRRRSCVRRRWRSLGWPLPSVWARRPPRPPWTLTTRRKWRCPRIKFDSTSILTSEWGWPDAHYPACIIAAAAHRALLDVLRSQH